MAGAYLNFDISNRQLTVDGFNIQLLGPSKSHLELPSKLIALAPAHRRTKTSHSIGQNIVSVFYYQDVCHNERAETQTGSFTMDKEN